MKKIFLLPVMSILSLCCVSKGFDFIGQNIDEIQYSYHDAPIAPECQRNYTISLNADKIQMIVMSFDSLITDTSFVNTQMQFDKIIEVFVKAKVRNSELRNNDGCTGGDSESISCFSEGTLVFSGNVYHCGGRDSGNLKGDLATATNAIVDLIPDFDLLLKR